MDIKHDQVAASRLVQMSHLKQGRREGGTMTPGPMDFRGPMGFRKAVGFSGPSIEMTLRNQQVKSADHHFSDQTTAFSPSILDFTKPEIRHI